MSEDHPFFIDRPRVLEKIRDWIYNPAGETQRGNQRVLSLVGPPGSGKTTLLKHLAANPPHNIKTMALPHPSAFLSGDSIPEDSARQILGEVFGILPDPHATPTAIAQNWVKEQCDYNPHLIPVFLADGYDEISPSQARVYSHKILEALISRECTRLIVAHREDIGLGSLTLRRHQHVLNLNEFEDIDREFAFKQFEHLAKTHGGSAVTEIELWMKTFNEYRWENPLLNELLFEKAWDANGKTLNPPNATTIEQIVAESVTRSGRFPRLNEKQIRYLYSLAELDETWSGDTAADKLNISNFYLDEDIRGLFGCGLIIEIPDSIEHRLARGFRGLLREKRNKRRVEP